MTEHDRARAAALPRVTLALLTAGLFLLLFSRSVSRFFDLDEHQFVAPPLLLDQEGRLPYRDYPYFHMPGLVFLYAAILPWFSCKLLAARTVSVLCGTATVVLLFVTGWRWLDGFTRRQRWLWAGGACAVYVSSRLFTYTDGWAWNHDSAVLAAVAAFLAYCRGLRRGRLAWFALAGFLAGLALDIRLSFALLFVPMSACLLLAPSALSRRRRWLALGGAALAANLALLPAWLLLLAYPERFLFGNLGYPQLSTLFYEHMNAGAMTLPSKVGHFFQTFLSDPGNAVLLIGYLYAGFAFVRYRPWHRPEGHAWVLLVALFPFLYVGVAGPSPTQYQYLYTLLPFMTLTLFAALARERDDPAALARWRWWALAGLVLAVGTGLPRWYWPVVRLPYTDEWVPLAVHRDGLWLRERVPPGGRVLTIDPLVPLEGQVAVFPEYAVGRFVMLVGPYTTADQRRRQRLAYGEELEALLQARPPASVFADPRTADGAPALLRHAESWGVAPETAPGGGRLWVAPPDRRVRAP